LDKLTLKQLQEWEAYDVLDPIGTWRDDFRMAKVIAVMQNIVIGLYSKKGSKPKLVSAYDEMPKWDEEPVEVVQKQPWETMKEFLLGFAKRHNKQIDLQEKLKKKVPKAEVKKQENEHR
jgi:hypothetical protein